MSIYVSLVHTGHILPAQSLHRHNRSHSCVIRPSFRLYTTRMALWCFHEGCYSTIIVSPVQHWNSPETHPWALDVLPMLSIKRALIQWKSIQSATSAYMKIFIFRHLSIEKFLHIDHHNWTKLDIDCGPHPFMLFNNIIIFTVSFMFSVIIIIIIWNLTTSPSMISCSSPPFDLVFPFKKSET